MSVFVSVHDLVSVCVCCLHFMLTVLNKIKSFNVIASKEQVLRPKP
jgi:hypothetical protein